jgi:hypothetical protein
MRLLLTAHEDDQGEPSMNWSTEEREGFLQNLDAAESVMVSIYRLMLGLVIAAVIAVVVLVVTWRPWGAGNQGEWSRIASPCQ